MVAQQLIYEHFMAGGYGGTEENLRCFLTPNFGHRCFQTKQKGIPSRLEGMPFLLKTLS